MIRSADLQNGENGKTMKTSITTDVPDVHPTYGSGSSMISRMNRKGTSHVALGVIIAQVLLLAWSTSSARAEERKYVVMLAHSPKSFTTSGGPGLPPQGLINTEIIRKDYFDNSNPSIDSFAEYWEEISYGDVTISGEVFEWVTLPWAFEPNGPNGGAPASPANYINLRVNATNACAPNGGSHVEFMIPPQFAYGAAEESCDCFPSGDDSTAIASDDCGALIIIDLIGDPTVPGPAPVRGVGLPDIEAVGVNVWTPGERFIDLNNDDSWNGIDEKNDMMCHGEDGCQNICTGMICEDRSSYCTTEADCPVGVGCRRGSLEPLTPCRTDEHCTAPETCGDPERSGPRGCDTPGCGDLAMPAIDFDRDDSFNARANTCNVPILKFCTTSDDCGSGPVWDLVENAFVESPIPCVTTDVGEGVTGICDPSRPVDCSDDESECGHLFCNSYDSGENLCVPPDDIDPEAPGDPQLCFIPPGQGDPELPDLAQCCPPDLEPNEVLDQCVSPEEGTDPRPVLARDYPDNPFRTNLPEGIVCGNPVECCEFDNFDGDSGTVDFVEPFEDFLIKWTPSGASPASVWTKMDREYIKNNYPGDVQALLDRTGNGYYDPPDVFLDRGNTKMMQDAGNNRFTWFVPKPGTDFQYAFNADEKPWFDTWWTSRYGTTAPAWPTGNGGDNGIRMREFDPAAPNPPEVESLTDRRWFAASHGGWSGRGRGTRDDPNIQFDRGGNEWDNDVLPEEEFGYYDGWVEHDDLASSLYHRSGDLRLGEITSPVADTVELDGEIYPAIFGNDTGPHNPNAIDTPDDKCVAAGPGAINIHGEKGYDAGDLCTVEWLTWRTDGTSITASSRWATDVTPARRYHPFATPNANYWPLGRCADTNPGDEKDATRVVCRSDEDCAPLGESCNRPLTAFGFRDYNVDGMIDQGETRPVLSENYSVDTDESTPDDGTHTHYPFNRSRIAEDVVEALDPSVDWDNWIDVNVRPGRNTVSGITIVPAGSYTGNNQFPLAPSLNYAIHTEDTAFQPLFSDLVICTNCRQFPSAVQYSAHEMLHSWEGYPDLYDYDTFSEAGTSIINCPIGVWDIMERQGSLVHPVPPLKEVQSGWIDPVDLKSILTPGVETTITLPPAEFNRNDGYYFLENSERSGERYYLWSAGSGFDTRLPGAGLMILKTNNFRANNEALALQQRTEPFNFRIVQADGRNDMLLCEDPGGNTGDDGDVWPGSTNATRFNFDTVPAATWQENSRWTGIDITNIQPDGFGSVRLTLSWVPTNIPGLSFLDPPGGESVGSVYRIRYRATDIHGGTDIQLYYTNSDDGLPDPSTATQIGTTRRKSTPGTAQLTTNWDVLNIPDGRYFLFAKLIPGTSPDGPEKANSIPRAGRNNAGNGGVQGLFVDVSSSPTSKSRTETWVLECIDPAGQEWLVNSSSTQPTPDDPGDDPFPHAFTCGAATIDCAADGKVYSSIGGEVRFVIKEGSVPFGMGDRFTFTTTGITSFSQGFTIEDGKVRTNPKAVIDPTTAVSGRPPLVVGFDARRSTDPEGLPLNFTWDFGDGGLGAGPEVTHTYQTDGVFTVVLRATNSVGQFGEATLDVNVTNNRPTAVITASRTSGPAPLTVNFDSAGSFDVETLPEQLIYQWDFGDGTSANSQGQPGTFRQVEHFYSRTAGGVICSSDAPCQFTVTLTVTDSGGKSSTATTQLLVGNSDPVPSITVSSTNGTSPHSVTFNADSSTDPDGDDIEIVWDFGDGTVSPRLPIAGAVLHEYVLAAGIPMLTYEPTATLFDVRGGVDRGGRTEWVGPSITVTAPVQGSSDPIADFELDPAGPYLIGDTITAKSSSRDRPNPATPLTEKWSFGDGTPEVAGREVMHTWTTASNPTFTVTLTVTDPDGNEGRHTEVVQVTSEPVDPDPDPDPDPEEENLPPTASFVVNSNGDPIVEDRGILFDASASSDPEGGNLHYRWNFGDGTAVQSGMGPDFQMRTHVFSRPGSYTVLLTVTDDKNAAADATRQILVQSVIGNRPPVPVLADGARAGPAPLTVELNGQLSFDPDGNPLDFRFEFTGGNGEDEVIEGRAVVSKTFETEGVYTVVMRVDDGIVDDEDVPFVTATIRVTSPIAVPEPPPGTGVPPEEDRAGSHTQRPTNTTTFCGFGMLPAIFATLLGLSIMRFARRRF